MPKGTIKVEFLGAATYNSSWAQTELNRLESLGMFGGNNNFNGSGIIENIEPEEGDFVEMPFRLLSATTVAAGSYRATTFPPSVLRKALHKFGNVPVFPNHDQEVGNELGIVKPDSLKWVGAKVTKENLEEKREGGLKIPGGVEGVLRIDAKSNPSIARSVLTGAITSVSVTVDFEWKPSHKLEENETNREFSWKVGTMATDGKMFTRVATSIRDIFEVSLVWLGADPFAKKVNEDGELVNVDTGNAVEFDNFSFSANPESKYNSNISASEKRDGINTGNLQAVYSYRRELGQSLSSLAQLELEDLENKDNLKIVNMKKEILELILTMTGVATAEELTTEMFVDKGMISKEDAQSLKDSGKSIEDLVKASKDDTRDSTIVSLTTNKLENLESINELTKEVNTLKVEATKTEANTKIVEVVSEFTKLAENETITAGLVRESLTNLKGGFDTHTTNVEALRTEVKKFYTLSVNTPDEAILGILEEADHTKLVALGKTYGKKAMDSYTATCKSCGSAEVSLRSSVDTDTEPKADIHGDSFEDITAKYGNTSMNGNL